MASSNSLLREPQDPAESSGSMRFWRKIRAIVFILFCLEIGIVLVLLPWSSLWDRNYFFALAPGWAPVFASSYLRGAISGIGVLNVWIAVSEAWRLKSG